MKSRWLVYALGGGVGHVQRSLALCRQAALRGHDCTVLASEGLAGEGAARAGLDAGLQGLQGLQGSVTLRWIRREAELSQRLAEWLEEPWDVFIVDTFARGLLGELAELLPTLKVPKVFVQRATTRSFREQPEVQQALSHYGHILWPGEGQLVPSPTTTAVSRKTLRTAPWLLLDAKELWPRERVRTLFDANCDLPLVVVCDSANAEESHAMCALTQRLSRRWQGTAEVRFAELKSTWPLMQLHAGIDCLVGAGGYNTVYEARATGTPLLAMPRERSHDRQAERLRPEERFDELSLPEVRARSTPPAGFTNGALDAVRWLEQCLTATANRDEQRLTVAANQKEK